MRIKEARYHSKATTQGIKATTLEKKNGQYLMPGWID